jgi:phosphoglycerate dehydrogenase-like enzyme
MSDSRPIVHVDRLLTAADRAHVGDRATIVGPTDDELPGAVATVIGVAHQWDSDRFGRFPDLRVVSRMGIGYDNIDVAAAAAAGVVVCNAPDAPTVSTAEHTVALMLAVTKELPDLQARAEAGERGKPDPSALELAGATLGLVGLGRIGRRVAAAAVGLGMRVVAFDPAVDAPPDDLPIEIASLDDVLRGSDVLSLHAPATATTNHLVGRETLPRMKRGVYIVNCARGSLVDQDALVDALDSGQVAGAALDVTVPEPLPTGHPLLGRTDVIVTPHIASGTTAGRQRLFAHAFDNVLAVLEGRPASIVTDSPT